MKDRGKRSYVKYTAPLNEGGKPYNGGGSGAIDCTAIVFETKLVKTKPAALAKARVGQLLPIQFDAKRNLAVYNLDGDICGYLGVTGSVKLSACMDKGFEYEAKLLNKIGDVKVMLKK